MPLTNNTETPLLLKSIILYQIEKLSILLKEVQNLYSISNYYDKVITQMNKSHLKNVVHTLQNELKELHEDIYENTTYVGRSIDFDFNEDENITKLLDNLKKLKWSKAYKSLTILDFQYHVNEFLKKSNNKNISHAMKLPFYSIDKLVMIDANRERISEYLRVLKFASIKLQQIANESFYQSKTKPTITKRFSSSNVMPLIERSLTKKYYEKLADDKEDNKRFYLTWDYINEHNLDHLMTYDNITLSYFYSEIMLINTPAISHESAHILKESVIYRNIEKVSKKLAKNIFIDQNKNISIRTIQFQYEFTADILAFFHHGSSYLLSLLHLLIGKKLSYTIDAKNYYKGFKIGPWSDHNIISRDIIFFRLLCLTQLLKAIQHSTLVNNISEKNKFETKIEIGDTKHKHTVNIITQIENLLHLIYPFKNQLSDSEFTLHDYYQNYQNIAYTYQKYFSTFKENIRSKKNCNDILLEYILIYESNLMKKKRLEKATSSFTSYVKGKKTTIPLTKNHDSKFVSHIPYYLSDIWKTWLNAANNNTIAHKLYVRMKIHGKALVTLINEKKILTLDDIQPYKAEFIKYTSFTGKENTCKKSSDIQETCKVALGFYDYFKIRKLNLQYKPERMHLKEDKAKFQLNHSLMQVVTPIKGEKKSTTSITSCVIQVDIKKSDIPSMDIYNDLATSIHAIHNILMKNLQHFTYAKIFKTLGPNDLLVYIENISIQMIYNIKNDIIGCENEQNRTFTTILYNYDRAIEVIVPNGYFFKTDIFGKISDEEINLNKYIDTIENSTGIFDYRIKWKECSLQEVHNALAKINKQNTNTIIENNTYVERIIFN